MDAQAFNLLTAEIRVLTLILMKAHTRAMEEHFRERGSPITPLQYGILRNLQRHPHTISELSKIVVLDPSSLVSVVDDLEHKGLVERLKDPQDRRRTPLNVTERGLRLLDEYRDFPQNDALHQSVQALGEERAVELLQLLREIVARLPDGETVIQNLHASIYRQAEDRCAAIPGLKPQLVSDPHRNEQ